MLTELDRTVAAAGAACEGALPTALAAIGRHNVDLAIWTRRLPPALAHWLDALPPAQLPRLRVRIGHPQVAAALDAAFAAAGTPGCAARDLLAADIVALTTQFARLVESPDLDLRLDTVDDDGCTRWHRDVTPMRLLCTYRGPGSERVDAEHAAAALADADDFAGPCYAVPQHAVAVLRGALDDAGRPWARGLVHRSPRIAGQGITRLLLCLNPAAGNAPWFVETLHG
jgi:hypothetical protein